VKEEERTKEREHAEREREREREREGEREGKSGRGTHEHGVDRALNPGPTGVLRRSTESLSGLELVPPLWFTAL